MTKSVILESTWTSAAKRIRDIQSPPPPSTMLFSLRLGSQPGSQHCSGGGGGTHTEAEYANARRTAKKRKSRILLAALVGSFARSHVPTPLRGFASLPDFTSAHTSGPASARTDTPPGGWPRLRRRFLPHSPFFWSFCRLASIPPKCRFCAPA